MSLEGGTGWGSNSLSTVKCGVPPKRGHVLYFGNGSSTYYNLQENTIKFEEALKSKRLMNLCSQQTRLFFQAWKSHDSDGLLPGLQWRCAPRQNMTCFPADYVYSLSTDTSIFFSKATNVETGTMGLTCLGNKHMHSQWIPTCLLPTTHLAGTKCGGQPHTRPWQLV